MINKAVCVHGHFYQPSREDPWTGEIPVEQGASPYQNWNERIFADCYAPNLEAGNFSMISFNLGPTLTRWMRNYQPEALSRIVAADRENLEQYGVGNAMAQPYHHTILPLASRRDKRIQVAWGIQDFRHTFGHDPEGIWLPETAVDQETLDVIAETGIKYTILAPWQVESTRTASNHPVQVNTGNGKSMIVFLYNSSLSSDISFNANATINADAFAQQRVLREFNTDRNDQLVMIATDGELYGHHQPFREKFLAHLTDGALHQLDIEPLYPGRWLKNNPTLVEGSLVENTSWSCMHGVSRWSTACGCVANGSWKKPLRYAIDQTAKLVDSAFEKYAAQFFTDPWRAVEDFARVFLEKISFERWLDEQASIPVAMLEKAKLRSLFDAQFERQRMYTSCGWFFEDFDRIEPRNNVAYAAHAIWLIERAAEVDLYEQAEEFFRPISSWRTGLRGNDVFAWAYYRFSGRS